MISNQKGSILLPVVIVTSVAILTVAIAISIIPNHQKEAMFIQQKLSGHVLKYGLEEILKNPESCRCLFNGKTINPSEQPDSPQTVDLDQIQKGGCGPGILISETGRDEHVGYGLKVNDIKVDNILLSSQSGEYLGDVVISYDTGSSLRSVGEIKIPIEIQLDMHSGTNTAKDISSCILIVLKSSVEKGNWCGFSGFQKGAPHVNGKGFVSDTATVDPSAYVGPDAKVCEKAKVLGNARIEGKAMVMDTSEVSGSARVFGQARILRNSRVSGTAEVSGHVRIYNSIISGRAQVSDEAKVQYSEITGDAVVKKYSRVSKAKVAGKSLVTDYTVIDLGAEINGDSSIIIRGYSGVVVKDYSRATRGAAVTGGAHVYDNAFISDGGKVKGNAQVGGTVQIGYGSEVNQGVHQ